MPALIAAQADLTPEATAVAFEGRTLCYAEFEARTNQLAQHLRRLGVGPEVRVGVCLERSIELVVAVVGVLKAGGVYTPLDPAYPPDRLAFLVADAGAPVVVSDARHAGSLPAHGARVVRLDADAAAIAREPQTHLAIDFAAGQLAYLIYTSGSTGRPKGAMNTHGGLANRLVWMQDVFALGAADRVLQKTPFSFDVSVWELLWPLMTGACVVMARPDGHKDPAYLAEVITRERISVLHFVPSMLHGFLDHLGRPGSEALTSVRQVVCSGEALPPSLVARLFERMPGARLDNLYGPTEAAIDVTWWPCPRGAALERVPIGRPIAGTQIHILDDALAPVPPGGEGELYIAGAGVARGYHGRPGLTAERFLPDPFGPGRMYRTGDRARWLADGAGGEVIEYLGRLDHQVKVRGFRIELGEIEEAARAHPGVSDAVVVARHADDLDASLTGYLVPDPVHAAGVARWLSLDAAGALADARLRELPNGLLVAEMNRGESEFVYRELFEADAADRHGIVVPDDACVFDVGANIGLFSLWVASRCADPVIYAFEPIPAVRRALELNAALHGLRGRRFDLALGARAGVERFTYYPRNSILSGRLASTDQERALLRTVTRNQGAARGEPAPASDRELEPLVGELLASEQVECRIARLSDVLADERIAHIDLLKIDVERSERDVLAGIADADWPRIRQVIVEVHDTGGALAEVIALLEARGFRVAWEQDAPLAGTELYSVYARRPELALSPGRSARGWSAPGPLIEDVRAQLLRTLPDYMVPASWTLLAELPLTVSGKVDRRRLPDAARGERAGREASPLESDTERAIADAFEQVLGARGVHARSRFTELGGTSLGALRVAARLRDALGCELPTAELLRLETPRALARWLADHHGGSGGPGAPSEFPPIVPAPRDRPLPLSFAQERVFFLERLDPGGRAYQFQALITLRGPLDVAALRASLDELIRRHEILRTTFEIDGEQPVQRIHPPAPAALELTDLGALAADERERTAGDLALATMNAPFDAARLPLIRWHLLRFGDDEHRLVHVEHHHVHDGWSFTNIIGELLATYQLVIGGGRPARPPAPLQFADYAAWERAWVEGPAAARQLAYWKAKLAGAPPRLELPTDRPRPARQSYRGALHRVWLSPQLTERARRLASAEGATLHVAMLTAFAITLGRWAGQDELCIGSAVANRRRPETEDMLGMFVNVVALRVELAGRPSFRQLVRRLRDVAFEAYAHQDLPFDAVVRALGVPRDASATPIFQVDFSSHDAPYPPLVAGPLRVSIDEGVSNGSAKFDLSAIAIPRPDGRVELKVEYTTDLFDEATVARIGRGFLRVLEAGLDAPDEIIDQLPLVSPDEAALAVARAHGAPARPAPPVLAAIDDAAARGGGAIAVVEHGRGVTYGELIARSRALAARLAGAAGAAPGARVALVAERSVAAVVALLAAWRAGLAVVPVDPTAPEDRLRALVADAQPACVIASDPALAVQVAWFAGPILDASIAGAESGGPADRPVAPLDAAIVLYTSGSTGAPKGVVLTHGALAWYAQAFRELARLGPGDRIYQFAPLHFDGALEEILGALTAGARLVLRPPGPLESLPEFTRRLEREAITMLDLPAAFWHAWMREMQAPGEPGEPPVPASLRLLIVYGEQAGLDAYRTWTRCAPRCGWINTYGPTETCVNATALALAPRAPLEATPPIGAPLPGAQAFVLDRELGLVPPGVPGELYVGGAGLARGYRGSPGLTAARFVPSPFHPGERLYRTGDIARVLPSGALQFVGRGDFQVKLDGFRIELGEVEAALAGTGRFTELVVRVHHDPRAAARLVAYVVPAAGQGVEPEALRAQLARVLPSYMLPADYVVLERLPRTASGKVDRGRLPAPVAAPRASRPAADPLERLVLDIFGDVLAHEVGPDDDFFAAGGSSLALLRVHARLARAAGVDLPLATIFEHRTAAALAGAVERAQLAAIDPARLAALEASIAALADDEARARMAGEARGTGP
ncbi:MAG TPA: amino acid adenylation domain-containing protein [Kofleriaceae bacterium]|nr:amino acid adenylation domain-containing protein [Kofleriaceae bacterium]